MKRLTLTGAFAKYGAKLRNVQSQSSAIAGDGSLVISCWRQFLKSYVDGHRRYEDRLSRWTNNQGREKLRKQLKLAVERDLPVRLVIVTLDDPRDADANITDARVKPKTFSTDADLVGKVVAFVGDSFAIDFHRV